MKIINLKDLNLNYLNENIGSFALIQKCEYNGQTFAYKEFNNIKYLKSNINKIKNLNLVDLDCGIFPAHLVYDEDQNEYSGYLTNYSEYVSSSNLKKLDNKANRLLKIKENIVKMHNIGIIHGDLHFGNILIDPNSCDNKIIDFDNCAYKKYKIKINYASDYAKAYLDKYGINKGIDIFLFNLMTYCVLNDCTAYYTARIKINNQEYGVFNNPDCKRICDSVLLDNKSYCKEFLIDTYVKKL